MIENSSTIIPTNDMKNPKFGGVTEGRDPPRNTKSGAIHLEYKQNGPGGQDPGVPSYVEGNTQPL